MDKQTTERGKAPSSIFLHEVTLIDGAYLDRSGRPVGVSLNPVFVVSGRTDNPESVVIDFSRCKKVIKELIDHKESGFDHKLWVGPMHQGLLDGGEIQVVTPFVEFKVPCNAVRQVPGLLADESGILSQIETALAEYLSKGMEHLGVSVQVTVPEPRPVDVRHLVSMFGLTSIDTVTAVFDYVHGLPNSSSWGCQNILHGHTSFITIGGAHSDQGMLSELAGEMAAYLNGKYLFDVTAAHEISGDHLAYKYATERGEFSVVLDTRAMPVVKIVGAPTIENIVDHIAGRFASDLNIAGVTFLAVSEGLWKGACLSKTRWERSELGDVASRW